jgi:glycosyltransferase involved in cell wall biosynthesis
MAALRAFAEVQADCPDASLIFVGAGPLEDQLKDFVSSRGVDEVHFTGYVPFEQLHEYFFASDVFLHLARSEPWGASPQDALVSNMALVVSSQVGSGVCHLTGDLARYVVGVNDDQAAAAVMIELVGPPSKREHFEPAWKAVHSMYTAESLARWWANRIDSSGQHSSSPPQETLTDSRA